MSSGDNLVKLFESFGKHEEEEFTKIAFKIIDEEEQKNHLLLANKLKKALLAKNSLPSAYKRVNYHNNNLPKDKDRGTNLIDIIYPERSLEDVILSEDKRRIFDIVLEENKKREILYTHGLVPKTKMLFCGPPGCGKTLSAYALANSLGVPVLYTRFDSLISSYLGETASNLRSVFDFASKGNWVLFFDEFDAIGKSRDNTDEHGELKRVVNTFLQLLDNFKSESFVIAATNHERMIDSALWRRFDDIIYFDKPIEGQISEYLTLKLRSFHHKELNINEVSKKLVGLSFSDIERICVETLKHCILKQIKSIDDLLFTIKMNDELSRMDLVKKIST